MTAADLDWLANNRLAVHRSAGAASMRQRRMGRRQPVTVQRVRPDIWQAARRLAGGNPALLRIVGPRTVRVLDGRYDPPR